MEQMITQLFGINPALFLAITIISAICWRLILGDDNAAFLATIVTIIIGSFLLAHLSKILNFVAIPLVILGGIIVIGFIAGAVMGVASEFKGSKKPAVTGTTTYARTSHPAPSRLFHGTPNLEWASDIVMFNRWRINRHSPHGIYMAEDFQTAKGYAGASGCIVEINVRMPSSLMIDISQIPKNSDQVVNQGYRLIRNKNIYIAPIPESQSTGEYFRVEGIEPVRVLDNYQNPISF